MWESSGGNPLFLRHLVEGSIDAGTLTKVDDVWQLRGPTAVPSGLAELLESRLDQAGEDVNNALKLLALCEPLDIDALCELAGEDAVDAAEARGLIRIVHDGPGSTPGSVTRSSVRPCGAGRYGLWRGGYEAVLSRFSATVSSTRPPPGSGWRSCMSTVTKSSIWTFSSQQPRTRSFCPTFRFVNGWRVRRSSAAVVCGQPSFCPALWWQGHPAQAEEILARFDPENLDEWQLVLWGISPVSMLFWSMVMSAGQPGHGLVA